MAGIETLYRFPVFQTREEYKQATGKEAPPYNPSLPVKSWFDPDPPKADEYGDVYYLGLALAADGRTPAVQAGSGLPFLRKFRIKAEHAGVVNIPVKKFDGSVQDPGSFSTLAALDVPFPCRNLLPEEELRFGFGATVQVHLKSTTAVPVESGATDPEVKALLVAINSKLDVLLATSRT